MFAVVKEMACCQRLSTVEQDRFRAFIPVARWVGDLLIVARRVLGNYSFLEPLLQDNNRLYAQGCLLFAAETLFVRLYLLQLSGCLRLLCTPPGLPGNTCAGVCRLCCPARS